MLRTYMFCKAYGGSVPEGTKVWWYESSAPTGWIIDDSAGIMDKLLAVKGGSGDYATGATTGGSWTQPDHTLTISEMPAHTHGAAGGHYHYAASDGFPDQGCQSILYDSGLTTYTSYYSHTLGYEGGSGGVTQPHNHGTTYRPKARVGIICSRDIGSSVDAPIGKKTWFYSDAHPIGWTLDATPSDELLAVKGSSGEYTTAASTGGTWTQPSKEIDSTQMPYHNHDAGDSNHRHTYDGAGGSTVGTNVSNLNVSYGTTGGYVTSSDGSHYHNYVGSGSAHTHASTYRPAAAVGIICSADNNTNFLTGNNIWMYVNTAPIGWTDVGVSEKVLGVKGGSTYTTGGDSTKGTWTQPDCTIDVSHLPSHRHDYHSGHTHYLAVSDGGGTYYSPNYGYVQPPHVVPTSSVGDHTHGSTGVATATHSHGSTYRPYACVGLICSKN